MSSESIYSDYDRFAWFYNRYWGGEFSRPALAIFNILLFPHLPAGCRVLDLCCGTGQLAAGLIERGFQVTGLDGSAEMLRFARENAPAAEFIRADARSFELPPIYDAVISAFDSLNHMMNLEELTAVFRRVRAALAPDGVFLFDLNMEDEAEMLGGALAFVEADHACIVRASYDANEKFKQYVVTMFRQEEATWRRSDLTLRQRYYTQDQVLTALAETGFSRVKAYDARREFGMTLSDGRYFYLARE